MLTRILRHLPLIRFLMFWGPKLGRTCLLLTGALLAISLAPAIVLPQFVPWVAHDAAAAMLIAVYSTLFGLLAVLVFFGRLIYVWAVNPELAREAHALGI